jgi:hypothetical protein
LPSSCYFRLTLGFADYFSYSGTPYKLSVISAGKMLNTTIYKHVVPDSSDAQRGVARTSSADAYQQQQPGVGRTSSAGSGSSSQQPPLQPDPSAFNPSSASLSDLRAAAAAVYVAPLAPGQLPVVQMRIPGGSPAAYAPPSAAYAPPSAAYAPPSAAYAPPSAAYAPSSAAYAPPSAAYAPPSAAYAPPSAAYAPPSAAYAPSSAAYAPPSAAYAPSSAAYAPPSAAYAPPSAAVACPLPAGWQELQDAASMKFYYVDPNGTVTWERPSAAGAMQQQYSHLQQQQQQHQQQQKQQHHQPASQIGRVASGGGQSAPAHQPRQHQPHQQHQQHHQAPPANPSTASFTAPPPSSFGSQLYSGAAAIVSGTSLYSFPAPLLSLIKIENALFSDFLPPTLMFFVLFIQFARARALLLSFCNCRVSCSFALALALRFTINTWTCGVNHAYRFSKVFLRFKSFLYQVSLEQLVAFSATAATATMTELPPLRAPQTGQILRTFQVMRCQNSPNAPNPHHLFFLLLFYTITATPCSPPVVPLISSGAGLLLWDSPTRTVILGQDFNHEWSDFGGKRDKTDRDAWHTASREAHEESLGVLTGHVVSRHKVIAQVSAVDHGVRKSTFASIRLACCDCTPLLHVVALVPAPLLWCGCITYVLL